MPDVRHLIIPFSKNLIARAMAGPFPIFFLALIVRLIYLFIYQGSPQFELPMVDAEEYHSMATELSHGALPEKIAFRPPLYPLMLGFVYMIFDSGTLVPRLIQIIAGALSCVLVQKIGNSIFGRMPGFWAGVTASFCGLMVYFDLELLPTSLAVLFNLACIYELLKIPEKSGSSTRAGLWLAISALTRPTTLTFYPLALLWLWKYTKNYHNIWKFLLGGILPLAVSLLLHIAIGAGPVVVSAQGGINFYIGNHAESDGMTARFPGLGPGWGWDLVSSNAEHAAGQSLNASQIDRYYWHKSINLIKSDPVHTMKHTWRKALLFWNRIEISNNRDLYYHGRAFPLIGWLMWIGFPLFLPLSIAAIASGISNNKIQLLTFFIFVQYLTIIPFFVSARFRHPLTPLLIILAIGGAKALIDIIFKKSDQVKAYAGTIGFVIGIFLLFAADSGIDTNRNDYGLFTDGKLYERLGKIETARDFYHRSLKENTKASFVNFHLAEIAREKGEFERAATYYRREIENQPAYAKAWNNLGVSLMELGEADRALECYIQALKLQPDQSEAAGNAARIWGFRALKAAEENEWLRSRKFISKARRYDADNPIYITLEIEARINLLDSAGIEQELEEILKKNPEFQPAINLLRELRSGDDN